MNISTTAAMASPLLFEPHFHGSSWCADHIELSNDVSIEVHANSFRAVRGRSILCAVLDEVAFFRDKNFASPDIEVDAALSPGLARCRAA